jgi:hypothetical protein
VAPAEPRAVRVVLSPVKLVGERVPSRPRLERVLRELSASWSPALPGDHPVDPRQIIPQATLDGAGTGRDRFGADHLAVLGAAPVRDA